ncbi:hypothetical protein [Massilia sp. Se16.2.3]|uniref:hypothetical protein n=1 Tax=Massilia sp. Se16.2.3 TaxID=2709303 RepID=UPI001E2CD0E2|nr:hypothetical protein [Massilia sp. Se16.2.3]
MKLARLLALPLLLAAAGGGALVYLQSEGATPRALAPYLLKRTGGHNPFIEGAGRAAAATLLRLDRGNIAPFTPPPLVLGAQPASSPAPAGAIREVASSEEARRAFATAAPGDVITFLPGDYAVRGNLYASRAGSAAAPIVVRAESPGTVRIAFDAAEGFVVTAPHWQFENLDIRGACRRDSCQHAFHVVGAAQHFVARNNTLRDFHAHIKINGLRGQFPDFGLIEANTLTNAAPRRTGGPVTPIDLVAASDWVIRANLVQGLCQGRRRPHQLWRVRQGRRRTHPHRAQRGAVRSAPGRPAGAAGRHLVWRRRHRQALLPRRALHHRA